MWKLNPNELLQLRGGGGESFTNFVDRLIHAEAFRSGLHQSEIRIQLRASDPDGGVDTEVRNAFPNDPTGWFGTPSCWQFKAVEAASISKKMLQEEINKPYAKELIGKGYAYRLCLLGNLPPNKCNDWESKLKAEAQGINPQAPDPRVIHGADLLIWAERFLAVVMALREQMLNALSWEPWSANCRKVTREYVPNPDWADHRLQILRHVDFSKDCREPCLAVEGAAGVGKTRLVFETLRELPAAPGIVVYASDEQEAGRIAAMVANMEGRPVILIADECTIGARSRITECIRGCVDRVRVICLDNTGMKQATGSQRIWLLPTTAQNTSDVLEKNFPLIPSDRRHMYAQLSQGFIRLAADMCANDQGLVYDDLSRIRSSVEEYVRKRIRPDHLPLLSLIALFHKVGFKGEVKAELDILCELSGRNPQHFKDMVRALKDSPGFVVEAGRYWYITPEIVARVLFAEGWQRWVQDDPGEFLQSLPEGLQQDLIDRAGKLGGEEVRAQLGASFRRWFDQLTGPDLNHQRSVLLVSSVIEAMPEEFLPKLRGVIESARGEDLLGNRGTWDGAGWGPRRTLVWLLERLAAFPDFFEYCEASLFRLAVHESEPGIGNNATAIWKNLYRIYLSGTAAPFSQRLSILETRISSSPPEELELAFAGFASALGERPTGHIIGPPVVAGRLRPDDWGPATIREEQDCYRCALTLCEGWIAGDDPLHRSLAFDAMVDNIGVLLQAGMLDEVARALGPGLLMEPEIRKVVTVVDDFLSFEKIGGRDRVNEGAFRYIGRIQEWIDRFRPTDFDGTLRAVCAREPWDWRSVNDPDAANSEMERLADRISSNPSLLQPHLDWLGSLEARSAERLGFALGKIDEDFACGRMIFDHAVRLGKGPLLRGYVRGMNFAEHRPSDELLRRMDAIESDHPQMAVDILSFAGDDFDALDRVIRLVESKAITPRFLAAFSMGVGRRPLRVDEIGRLLPYFVSAACEDDADSARAGVKFLFIQVRLEKDGSRQTCLEATDVRSQAWSLVESAVPWIDGQLSYEWASIVRQLADFDASRGADLLGQGLLSEGFDVAKQSLNNLADLASHAPEAVMEGLGKAFLDPKRGWHLQIRVMRELLEIIPAECIVAWTHRHGIEGARSIARHLPPPYVDDRDLAIVPEVLDTVLREFDDEQVFKNFAAGVHSGESWWGDGSDRCLQDVSIARRFLNHQNPWIRKWAKHEIAERSRMAELERLEYAEHALPG